MGSSEAGVVLQNYPCVIPLLLAKLQTANLFITFGFGDQCQEHIHWSFLLSTISLGKE